MIRVRGCVGMICVRRCIDRNSIKGVCYLPHRLLYSNSNCFAQCLDIWYNFAVLCRCYYFVVCKKEKCYWRCNVEIQKLRSNGKKSLWCMLKCTKMTCIDLLTLLQNSNTYAPILSMKFYVRCQIHHVVANLPSHSLRYHLFTDCKT